MAKSRTRTSKKTSRSRSRKRNKARKRKHASPSTAIVRFTAPPERPWELTNEQTVLLKNYLKIADASDIELKGCLEVSRRYKLDPFKQGQIWFVKRWDKNASSVAGTKGTYVYTPQVGIYGMLHIAARDYKDYGSISEAEFGPMFVHDVEGHKIKAPEWCRVKAYKKGIAEPTVATIYFEEFCPALWDNTRLFWAKMPRAQLEKCCKARVLRTAYPDLGGLYIPEEMGRIDEELTPGGRQIVHEAGVQAGTHEAAQRVLEAKLAGKIPLNPPEEPKASLEPPVPHSNGPTGAAKDSKGEKSAAGDGVSPSTAPTKGTIEVDWSEDAKSPILRGDLADLIEDLQKHFVMEWKGDWWHVLPGDVPAIKAGVVRRGYAFHEVFPAKSSAPQRHDGSGKTTAKRGDGGKAESGAVVPAVVVGTIEKVNMGMTGKNTPTREVKIGKTWHKCFSQTLHEFLDGKHGKIIGIEGEFYISGPYKNLVGFKRIGNQMFDEDGKTPCIQKDREAGGRTLF